MFRHKYITLEGFLNQKFLKLLLIEHNVGLKETDVDLRDLLGL